MGGAANGDTAINFIEYAKNSYKKMYLFEPNQLMFKEMKENLKNISNNKIEYISSGLYDSKGKIGFDLNSFSSRIDNKATDFITTVKLDDVVAEATFIKLDIEGAELQALKGAQKLIKKCQPILAICLYHKPSDLVEIPLLIHSINPNYKLYIRKYGNFGELIKYDYGEIYIDFDTVCYAIPSK